jgi:hypothetical protein
VVAVGVTKTQLAGKRHGGGGPEYPDTAYLPTMCRSYAVGSTLPASTPLEHGSPICSMLDLREGRCDTHYLLYLLVTEGITLVLPDVCEDRKREENRPRIAKLDLLAFCWLK